MRARWIWVTAVAAALAALIASLDALIDEPLRTRMQTKLNSRLQGYTVVLGALDYRLWDFSLTLKALTIVQDANPDPPVAHIPSLTASVQWRELLRLHLVGDLHIDRPTVYFNRKHFLGEARDRVALKDRGWQDALEAIYPLKINEFKVVDGDITYVDDGPFKPLHISKMNFLARNIRNIRSKERVYPSGIHLEGAVFGAGRVLVDGQADFLAEPHLGVRANIRLEQVELDNFKPITNRYNVSVEKGILSAVGSVEWASTVKTVALDQVTVRGVRVDYVHTPRTAEAEKQVVRTAIRSAKEVSNHPDILLRINRLTIGAGIFGFVNKAAQPTYRLFLANTDVTVENLTNQRTEGPVVARLRGAFMGTGHTVARVAFRPERQRVEDLDLRVRIEDTDMVRLNDLLRAYANFDVVDGRFSLYSELSIKQGTISGYVKPLIRGLDVYDARQDGDKRLSRRMYEGLVGGAASLLQNSPRREVATKAEISGSVDEPQVNRWRAAMRLIGNAVFATILPGFEELIRPARAPAGESPPPDDRQRAL